MINSHYTYESHIDIPVLADSVLSGHWPFAPLPVQSPWFSRIMNLVTPKGPWPFCFLYSVSGSCPVSAKPSFPSVPHLRHSSTMQLEKGDLKNLTMCPPLYGVSHPHTAILWIPAVLPTTAHVTSLCGYSIGISSFYIPNPNSFHPDPALPPVFPVLENGSTLYLAANLTLWEVFLLPSLLNHLESISKPHWFYLLIYPEIL